MMYTSYDDVGLHVTSLCDESMMLLVDVTHHVTCLDTQLTVVAFNSEPTIMQHVQASHSHVGVDGACACKKK